MNVHIRNPDDVGLLLRRLRKGANLTLRQVEEQAGVPIATQSQWETGKRCPHVGDRLIELLSFYRVSVTLGWKESRDEHGD